MSGFYVVNVEAEHRQHALTVCEGICPRCSGRLIVEHLKGVDYGVCERCQLAHVARVQPDGQSSWSESSLWWLRDDPPPPIDPDAPVIDLTESADGVTTFSIKPRIR